jgi:molybdopterin/thiamine biosynthesis adenylyltransferase
VFLRRRDITNDLDLASAPSALPPREPTESRRGPSPAQIARVDAGDLYSRNWAFIAPELQEQLATTTIFAAGAGLASTITALACRTGFARFIVSDGDHVEASNLNRQAFSYAQIGTNKAAATAEVLRGIRPDAQVEVLPHFLDERSFAAPLARADLVINSIDFDQPALFALNDAAQAAGKPVLFPLNLGWGGALLVFTPCSPGLDEFLGLDPSDPDTSAHVEQHLVARIFEAAGGVPPYLATTLADYQTHGASWPSVPQLGIASHLSAAMVVRAAVALVAGEPVRAVPEVTYQDLRLLLEPAPPIRQPSAGAPREARDRGDKPHAIATPLPAAPVTPDSQQRRVIYLSHTSFVPRGQAAAHSGEPTAVTPPTSLGQDAYQLVDAAETAARAYEQRARLRQERARYPTLLQAANTRGGGVVYRRRRPSGMIALAVTHDALSSEQVAAIGEWRLDQYVLCGLYDAAVLAARELHTDPAMQELTPDAIHTFAGTADGRLLAYCCVQPATGQVQQPGAQAGARARLWLRPRMTMAATPRDLFPSERELFGPEIFASLAAVRKTPVPEIRELTRLVHNQVMSSRQVGIAVVEVLHALTQVLVNRRLGIRWAVGNMGAKARQAVARLQLPVLYARDARVVVTDSGPDYDYWIAPANFDRSFWPFVVASADLRAIRAHLRRLDRALSDPAPKVAHAVAAVTRQARRHLPNSLLRSAQQSSLLWAPDDISPPR